MSISDHQQKALIILPILPSILSLTGSSCIVYRVVAREKMKSPYDRILLGLSCCDILLSLNLLLYAFLVDKDKSEMGWAIGNEASCDAVAFLLQATYIPSILYNGGLALYFVATIRFGITPRQFSKKFEPALHGVVILWPLCTAIAGLVLDLYTVVDEDGGIGCWVAKEHVVAAWLFGGIPLLSSFAVITVCNLIIYIFVRNRTRRTLGSSMNSEADAMRIRKVAAQAFLYVGSFFASYVWTVFVIVVSVHFGRKAPFPLYVVGSLFFPLQGFWNCFIFARPRYLKFRFAFGEESRCVAMQWAVFGNEDLPNNRNDQSSDGSQKDTSPDHLDES